MEDIKQNIINSFLEIYKKKSIYQIQVNDIARSGNFGRSTFYKYYKNVYNLLESIEESILDDMGKIYGEYSDMGVPELRANIPDPSFYEIFKYITKNKNFFDGALSEHGNYLFKKRFKSGISKKLVSLYGEYFDNNEVINSFVDYVSEMIIMSICTLIKDDNIINAKFLSIKIKNFIIDFIENKELYFNNK